MKRLFICIVITASLVSCGTIKPTTTTTISRYDATNIEGDKIVVEEVKMQGVEIVESLSDDGTQIIKHPYKWYAGTATADNKQIAMEMAQGEAYATISRVLSNVVKAESERGALQNNGVVQTALKSHWEQVSYSLTRGCEPFGTATVEYNPATGMYTATVKIGIRGDKFNTLLASAGDFRPNNLTEEELNEFIEVNKAILSVTKGN